MSGFIVVIPARFGSQRLPGKPLIEVAGKPLIVHVLECAAQSAAERVIVATDDARIADAVDAAGGESMMTSPKHPSGTDRIAEVAERLGLDDDRIIVNVQGDEPDMPAALIDQVAAALADDPQALMSTATTAISDWKEFIDPAVVKVVTGQDHYALYFSRAPIPWPRDDAAREVPPPQARRHIGMYAYRSAFLRRYVQQPLSANEGVEHLEQLRVVDAGGKIAVVDAIAVPGAGIDTADDLAAFSRRIGEA